MLTIMSDYATRRAAESRIQVVTSPYQGDADLGPLTSMDHSGSPLDPISIADLLRNAFVYPPHSIYRDVKVASAGFDPAQDLYQSAEFRFPFPSTVPRSRPPASAVDKSELVNTYHRLLCDAVRRSTDRMQSTWMLQSGGKDSTSLAIAIAEVRPQTTCLTYLGGPEENEVSSARIVAHGLGLRHEVLVCDPGRAYDRYLALVPKMPLLCADFALLSYVDLAAEIALGGGDSVMDGCGSDVYFGLPVDARRRLLTMLARRMRLPRGLLDSRFVGRSFKLCFALSTLEMDATERYYPGSRFSDAEVDALMGRRVSDESRSRLGVFRRELRAAESAEGRRRVAVGIADAASYFTKGQYVTSALGLGQAYPYCDADLCHWIYSDVPDESLIDRHGQNKPLVREHIARRFGELPYAKAKGSFRFDLCGLARERFDQVHAIARSTQPLLPGAARWLETHRDRMENKFFASKFYLLAVVLPWLHSRMQDGSRADIDGVVP